MKPVTCWTAVFGLGTCAILYGTDAFGFRSSPAAGSIMRTPAHGDLYFAAATVFAALGFLALALPRLAGAFGIGGYLLVLVLQIALVGDRARDYNTQHGLQFGDPGRQMPLALVTDHVAWHLLRLGLPILALSATLAQAGKPRDESPESIMASLHPTGVK